MFCILPLNILEEIQCLAASLLYLISENYNLNLSCMVTAGDETVIRLLADLVSLFYVRVWVLI